MRRAKYSAKKVYLPNASLVGYGLHFAKPGYWLTYPDGSDQTRCGRVLGRVDETPRDGLENCAGFVAVMQLSNDMTNAYVRWVDPAAVTSCQVSPPAALLAWISGTEWPKRAADIPRMLAMAEHGTCSEDYISQRNDPDKPYNCSPEYVAQFAVIGDK